MKLKGLRKTTNWPQHFQIAAYGEEISRKKDQISAETKNVLNTYAKLVGKGNRAGGVDQ